MGIGSKLDWVLGTGRVDCPLRIEVDASFEKLNGHEMIALQEGCWKIIAIRMVQLKLEENYPRFKSRRWNSVNNKDYKINSRDFFNIGTNILTALLFKQPDP
jgi:hypothetical protein